MSEIILDVRERDEFEAEYVEHSINVPLSHFLAVAPGVLNQLKERKILLLCRSGARAAMAAEQIKQLGYSDKLSAEVFKGGILEWIKRGKSTIKRRRNHLPIMRQVQLIAGSVVLVSTLLGITVHSGFLFISAFFGAGLAVAGLTGFCGMAIILSKMPWNKTAPTACCEPQNTDASSCD